MRLFFSACNEEMQFLVLILLITIISHGQSSFMADINQITLRSDLYSLK